MTNNMNGTSPEFDGTLEETERAAMPAHADEYVGAETRYGVFGLGETSGNAKSAGSMVPVCYCSDGTCDFCAANLYAVIQEDRLRQFEDNVSRLVDKLDDKVDRDDFSSDVKDVINNEFDFVSKDDFDPDDYSTTSDMERAIETAVDDCVKTDDFDPSSFDPDDFIKQGDFDPDDYVQKDDLAEEIRSALEDGDVVKDAASGAVEAAMNRLGEYVMLSDFKAVVERLEASLKLAKADVAMAVASMPSTKTLTFGERLRVLFTGRL